MSNNLVEQVLKTIRNYDMLEPGDTVLAAVSGGPDSVFLLYALNQLKAKLKLKAIAVCNLDHGLRGKESRQDSLFVKRLAEKAGARFIHKKINLDKVKRNGFSTEELARQARYKFFKEAAERSGANVIATGHTLDDQAETVLMRFIKGASLKGILGISPVRDEGGFSIIRPLLELEKDLVKKFLDGKNIAYRLDCTNLEPIYFRNVVRQEIIPFLEKYNPRLKRVLFNLSEHLREDFQFIEERMNSVRKEALYAKKGSAEIKLKDIIIQPKAIQKEILRDLLGKTGGEIKGLSFRHWKEMENLIKHKRSGSSVDLPGGIRLTRTQSVLVFHRI